MIILSLCLFSFLLYLSNELYLSLAVLNIVMLIEIYRVRKSFLLFLYTFVNGVIFIMPILIYELFGISHPLFIDSNDWSRVLAYALLYNTIVFITLTILDKTIINKNHFNFMNYSLPIKKLDEWRIIISVAFLMLIAFVAQWYLKLAGVFSMVYIENREACHSFPMLQLFKTIARYDLVCLLILGYLLVKTKSNKMIVLPFFIIVFILALHTAFITASRFNVITIFIIQLYIFSNKIKKHKFLVILFGLALLPIFNLVAIYRVYNDQTLFDSQVNIIEAIKMMLGGFRINQSGLIDVFITPLVDRLNYLDVVARVINGTNYIKNTMSFPYYQNIVGLIPRLFWSQKPIIGMDLHALGKELLILGSADTKTSIGLSIIGESYYAMKLCGLFIAVFHGILLWIIDVKFHSANIVGYVLYPLLSIYIVSKDGFVAVLPGLVYVVLPLLFVLFIFNSKKVSKVVA